MIRKTLALCIVLLFIVSSVMPMVIGGNKETKDIDNELEATLANLRYLCTYPDGFDYDKFNYYKEELLNGYSKDDTAVVEPVEALVYEEKYLPLDGPMDSAWPMKCHDLYHTGRSPVGTADIAYNELWAYYFDSSMDVSPAIGDDGTIYVGGAYGETRRYLFAINPDGSFKWKYKTDGLIMNCCPSIAEDGTIYITSMDDCLYAFTPNGTRKWKFDSGLSIFSSTAIGSDGTIYFGTMAGVGPVGKIFAVNPDGTEKWQYSTSYHILSDPAIGEDGTIYIGSGDEYLYAMNPNGTLKWKYKTADDVRGPPSIADDGTIYINSRYIYALYPNGTLRWKTEPWWYGSQSNPSIDSDGTIYSAWASSIFAFNPDNGDILWEFKLGGGSTKSSPAMCADGIIYIGVEIGERDGGELVAVNSDGTLRWRSRLSNHRVESSPAIGDDGTVYICSTRMSSGYSLRGHLHAFNELDPNAPNAPTITGESEGRPVISYDYTFSAVDPNDDDVFYQIYWGNGEDLNWIGPFDSGEEVVVDFTYYWEGTFRILARAKDVNDIYGPWSELEVTMPVNQQSYSFPLLQRLLERFPNMFPILRNLIEAQC